MNFESYNLHESFGFFRNKKHEDEIHDANYHNVLMDDYDEEILRKQPDIIKTIMKSFIDNEIKSVKYIDKKNNRSFRNWIIKFDDGTKIKLIYNQNKDIEEYFLSLMNEYTANKIYRITRSQFHIIENSIKEHLK